MTLDAWAGHARGTCIAKQRIGVSGTAWPWDARASTHRLAESASETAQAALLEAITTGATAPTRTT